MFKLDGFTINLADFSPSRELGLGRASVIISESEADTDHPDTVEQYRSRSFENDYVWFVYNERRALGEAGIALTTLPKDHHQTQGVAIFKKHTLFAYDDANKENKATENVAKKARAK